MKRFDLIISKKLIYILLAALALSCKDSYDLPVNVPSKGYLVVDGTINSGQGSTTINLSRTVRLTDTFNINYVVNATVIVEGQDNSKFVLAHRGRGQYVNDQLALNRNQKYRLHINADGKEYLSDYLAVQQSPRIDSVNWVQDASGVHIFVDAKGNANTSGYYRWDYEENWEFNAAYAPNLRYDVRPKAVFIFPSTSADMSKFTCYQSASSSTIEILSTAKLSRDTTHYRVATVPRTSWKISVLYSINVRQYSISRDGFEYLSKMKKNTEQTGSIFDSQPSELKGNLTCVSDANEPVIGFLEVSEMYSKRIFIKASQVPGWGFSHGCIQYSVVNHPDSIIAAGQPPPVAPEVLSLSGDVTRFWATERTCVDCTLRGVLNKPTFWP
jgi:uncharacterized protein DUF4249